MDVFLTIVGAGVASWLSIELYRSWRRRPRLHSEIWAMAFGAYALAMWALAAGLGLGWTSFSFRSFYFFGAIANISLLAAGSIALHSVRAGEIAKKFVGLWLVFGFFATFLATFSVPLPSTGIPEGSDVFEFTFSIEALTLPGPRLVAAISGGVATIIIVGLAVMTVLRSWSSMRRLAYGNVLIAVGTIVPALGGSLTALGESSALAVSLTLGIVLLASGYRLAVSSRSGGSDPEAARSGQNHGGEQQND
ncbi:MAG: hypothetical protein BMS9Abin17_0941 [Acidimicrobiia bacterium]|nr:MAG: hypothetical protein BMS9Abin17_0941 [Acidimicrobiia bacterium]